MIVQLLTEHHLEFLSLKGGCRGSSKAAHVKMPHCWRSHALAHIMSCENSVDPDQLENISRYSGTMIKRKPSYHPLYAQNPE